MQSIIGISILVLNYLTKLPALKRDLLTESLWKIGFPLVLLDTQSDVVHINAMNIFHGKQRSISLFGSLQYHDPTLARTVHGNNFWAQGESLYVRINYLIYSKTLHDCYFPL